MTADVDRLRAALAGRYTIGERLGTGGMATVYRAQDVRHERPVALKVMRPELVAVLGPERFLHEIRVTARLQHPQILPLHDSGTAEGLLYYVMPLVEGESLRERLARDKALPLEEVVTLAADVARALDYAHRQGVVHRDIKPENILLHEGQAVVADFGIALAVSEAGGDRLTATGLSVGTPAYMSPEQATGEREVDGRTDVYALGSVVFEMLAGDAPFTGESVQAVMAQVIADPAPPVRAVRGDVPPAVDQALRTALAKRPDDRFPTAGDFAAALARGAESSPRPRRISRRAAGVATILAVVALAAVAVTNARAAAQRRWAREVALPEIERLLLLGSFVPAYDLAERAARYVPDDAQLRSLRGDLRGALAATSEPEGAAVAYATYAGGDSTWYPVAQTPFDGAEVPLAWNLRLRFTHEGYQPVEMIHMTGAPASVTLVPDSGPANMVWVPAGSYAYASATPVPLDRFLLDQYEVTNRAFQEFVDRGGYADSSAWTEAVAEAGVGRSFAELVDGLRDRTGRPGPAQWELSQHPPGQGDRPVRGVSWFEAAAYCASVGKSLPTYYHWKRAAGLEIVDDMLKASNFAGDTTWAVGASRAVGGYGAYDMAGNVAEWTWNTARGRRYLLGGSFTEPEYTFLDANAVDPFGREASYGFRCAIYPAPPDPMVWAEIGTPYFDFSGVVPASDREFEIFRRFYDYERAPLSPSVERVDSGPWWIRQRVSYAAAYGGERVIAYVYLPRTGTPPYQSVVFFPGAGAIARRTSEPLAHESFLAFLPRSGRALVYPIYKGTHERFLDPAPAGKIGRRQRTVWMTQDLRRTLDYLEARDDFRSDAIGYLGLSLGAEIVVPFAMEPRLAALVLVGGAFDAQWLSSALPEAAPWNFASRVRAPALILNGRNDFQHPFETGQIPFFNALGTPRADKDTVMFEAGHIPPWNEVIRHTLDWLDRYLGPVATGR